MSQIIQFFFVVTAVLAVAAADIFLKKAALAPTLVMAFRTPWMVAAVLLYLYQIFFLTYFFVSGWNLSAIGSLQTAVYVLVVVGVGIVVFKETLTPTQLLGIVLASAGAILITGF